MSLPAIITRRRRSNEQAAMGGYVLQVFNVGGVPLYPVTGTAIFGFDGASATGNANLSWIRNAQGIVIDRIVIKSGTGTFNIVNITNGSTYLGYVFTPPHYPYVLQWGKQGIFLPSGFGISVGGLSNFVLSAYYRVYGKRDTDSM